MPMCCSRCAGQDLRGFRKRDESHNTHAEGRQSIDRRVNKGAHTVETFQGALSPGANERLHYIGLQHIKVLPFCNFRRYFHRQLLRISACGIDSSTSTCCSDLPATSGSMQAMPKIIIRWAPVPCLACVHCSKEARSPTSKAASTSSTLSAIGIGICADMTSQFYPVQKLQL
jgi:hypothetical protein